MRFKRAGRRIYHRGGETPKQQHFAVQPDNPTIKKGLNAGFWLTHLALQGCWEVNDRTEYLIIKLLFYLFMYF